MRGRIGCFSVPTGKVPRRCPREISPVIRRSRFLPARDFRLPRALAAFHFPPLTDFLFCRAQSHFAIAGHAFFPKTFLLKRRLSLKKATSCDFVGPPKAVANQPQLSYRRSPCRGSFPSVVPAKFGLRPKVLRLRLIFSPLPPKKSPFLSSLCFRSSYAPLFSALS